METDWKEAQKEEIQFWGTCQNTYGEETKQLVYARLMGLIASHDGNSPFSFDIAGKKILDIGGGPSSLLLKCRNLGNGSKVVDPLEYPSWIVDRYALAGLLYERKRGEDIHELEYDEVWIYNVLQHTIDPEQIVMNALLAANKLRIFEWIDIPPHPGHPHQLTEDDLNDWIGSPGKVGKLNGEGTCYGKYYAGEFIV